MMDLIGYWVAITLVAAPLPWLLIILMESWVSTEIKDVTGTAGKRPFLDALNFISTEKELVHWVFMILFLVSIGFYAVGAIDPEATLIRVFDNFGTKVASIVKYPAVFVMAVCVYFNFIKKPLVKLYKLKAKLDL